MKPQITKRIESLLENATPEFLYLNILLFLLLTGTVNAQGSYLKRSIGQVPEVKMEISTNSAHYKALFGEGDDSSGIIKAINRYGNLTIDPMGSSRSVNYSDEELVLFVLDGTGILKYDKEEVPVSKNDFIYIPVGTKFGLTNPRERSLSVIVMGFKIFPGTNIKTTPRINDSKCR